MRAILMAVAVPILGMLLPTMGTAQTYKCVVDGRTTYQSTPCPGNGQRVHITPTAGVEAPKVQPVEQAAAEPAKKRKPADVSDCIVIGNGPFIKCGVLK